MSNDLFDDLNLQPSKNEAGWHPAVKNSFVFLPSAGMRVSSDDLIIELYRELFYEKWTEGKSKRLDPEEKCEGSSVFTEEEKYSLYISRGRVKSHSTKECFYTPLYPSLARSSWLRKQSDRVIRDFFLRALAQHIHNGGDQKSEFRTSKLRTFHSALIGDEKQERGLDLSSIKIQPLDHCIGVDEQDSKDKSYEKLIDLCGSYTSVESGANKSQKKYSSIFSYSNSHDDLLASRIFEDLISICELESTLDRYQWMQLLQTFIRLSSSVWLLAQMNITLLLRDCLLKIIESDKPCVYDVDRLDSKVNDRFKNLFRPTSGFTHQLEAYVLEYVKARSELNLLVAVVEKYSESDWSRKSITMHSVSSDHLSVLDLFSTASKVRGSIIDSLTGEGLSFKLALIRKCEEFNSWSDTLPFAYTGKGISEYLRVLRKMSKGDEDEGYLVIPSKKTNQGYEVFPGNLMLKMITYLASKSFSNKQLILADVETHFRLYGIDFSKKGSMRPRLISALQELGLLIGTPDAGDSVAILNPYNNQSK